MFNRFRKNTSVLLKSWAANYATLFARECSLLDLEDAALPRWVMYGSASIEANCPSRIDRLKLATIEHRNWLPTKSTRQFSIPPGICQEVFLLFSEWHGFCLVFTGRCNSVRRRSDLWQLPNRDIGRYVEKRHVFPGKRCERVASIRFARRP